MNKLLSGITLYLLFCFILNGSQTLIKAKKIQISPSVSFEPGEVLIYEDKIKAVGKSLAKTKNQQILDWSEFEIYPGLISPGSSLGLAEINALRPTRDEREVGSHTPEIEAWSAINPDSELIPVAKANGITHALIIPLGGEISGTSGIIVLDGWGIEEMTIRKKVAVHLWWPGQTIVLNSNSQINNSNLQTIKEQDFNRNQTIRNIDEFFIQAENYKDLKKIRPQNFQINPSWEAMIPVLDRKLPLIIHANEKREITTAINWGKKRNYKIILSGARDSWKLADELAKEKIPVIYRHIFTPPVHRHDPHHIHFSAPSILAKAGVQTSIGLPLGAWSAANQRNLPYHAAHGIAYGLKRTDALAAITINPAKLIGMSHRLGTLEKGKDATLIACTGDILDIRSKVVKMLIQGRKVSLESRHTRLNKKYLGRPKINN